MEEGLLVLLSLALAFIEAETVLRTCFPQISDSSEMMTADPEPGWRFRAGRENRFFSAGGIRTTVATNSWGFRDNEPDDRESNRRRVMVLGNSFVSNLAVNGEAVFTERLEGMPDRIDVMNFGVNGYSTVQEFLLLKQVLPCKPAPAG